MPAQPGNAPRIVAVLAVRNERARLRNCLNHLVENGIAFAVIDHGSDDGSDEVLRDPGFAPFLVESRLVPFDGVFDLKQLLNIKQDIIGALETDWVIHLDADEIMHPYDEGESLREGIARLDREGFDAINLEEFVFLPVDGAYRPDHDGMQPLRHYYFFAPQKQRLVRIWRKDAGLSNVERAGHAVGGAEFRIAPENFVLRHYIFRDQQHAYDKYRLRPHKPENVARGWHHNRVDQPVEKFLFPPAAELECLASPEARDFRKDKPYGKHYWQW